MPTGKSRFDQDDAAGQRPNHPDFWLLSEIVLGNDAAAAEQMDEGLFDLFQRRAAINDAVLAYIAQQRTMRSLNHFPRSPTMALLATYTDGFTAGVQWGLLLARRAQEQPDVACYTMPDGECVMAGCPLHG